MSKLLIRNICQPPESNPYGTAHGAWIVKPMAHGGIYMTQLVSKGNAVLVESKVKYKNFEVNVIGIAKGSGMIAPNMGTMLAYIFTDLNVSSKVLQKILTNENDKTFNSITVDSDTSTSETCLLISTNQAKNKKINNENLWTSMKKKTRWKLNGNQWTMKIKMKPESYIEKTCKI